MAVTAANATACLANNVSGSFGFAGMRNMATAGRNNGRVNFNNQTQAEWAWHVAIDRAWPGLNGAQRAAVRAYCRAWGPVAQPDNPAPGTRDFFRFWRTTNGVPRCATCTLGHGGMPLVPNVPIGLDHVDLMPCGCSQEEAFVEHWLIGTRGWTRTQTFNRAAGQVVKIAVMGRDIRVQFVQAYKVALALAQNTTITYQILAGNGQSVQDWPVEY
ncbi:hypothetical protein MBLNU459_g1900t1 [Dothideomycetes sp. NU459]